MKSFEQFSEDNNEIQIGDRFVPLRNRRSNGPLKLEPRAMDAPREAPVRSYVDKNVIDTSPKLDLRRDMETKLDKDAEKTALSGEQRIARLLDRNDDIYSEIRNDKLLQSRILGNADFAENFFGSEMFRNHFMDLDRLKSKRAETPKGMRPRPGQEGERYPRRYSLPFGPGALAGSRNAVKTEEEPSWFDTHELDDEDKFYDYARAVARIMDTSYGEQAREKGEDMSTGNKDRVGWGSPYGFRMKKPVRGPKDERPMEDSINEWLSKFSSEEINELSNNVNFSDTKHFSMAGKAKDHEIDFDDIPGLGEFLRKGLMDEDVSDVGFSERIDALAKYAQIIKRRRQESNILDERSLGDFMKNPFEIPEEERQEALANGHSEEDIKNFVQNERIGLMPAGRLLFGDKFGIDNDDYEWLNDEELDTDEMLEDLMLPTNGDYEGDTIPLLAAITDMVFDREGSDEFRAPENREQLQQLMASLMGKAFDEDPEGGFWENDMDASAWGGRGLLDDGLEIDDVLRISGTDADDDLSYTAREFIDNIDSLRTLAYEGGEYYNDEHDAFNDEPLIDSYDMRDIVINSSNNDIDDMRNRVQDHMDRTRDNYDERIADEFGDVDQEDGFDPDDLYRDGDKRPDLGDVNATERKSHKDDYTEFSTNISNNPNEYGTHRYETLDADLKKAGLTRSDLKKSMYIAWTVRDTEEGRDKLAKKYKAQTGNEPEGPEYDKFQRRAAAMNAMKNWKQNVLPSLKPGTILYNTPITGGAGGNMREVLYSRMGFGNFGPYGQQAVVGKDGKVYPIDPKSPESLGRNQERRAAQRRRRVQESMGEVMFWWQQNPILSQEDIIAILNGI